MIKEEGQDTATTREVDEKNGQSNPLCFLADYQIQFPDVAEPYTPIASMQNRIKTNILHTYVLRETDNVKKNFFKTSCEYLKEKKARKPSNHFHLAGESSGTRSIF